MMSDHYRQQLEGESQAVIEEGDKVHVSMIGTVMDIDTDGFYWVRINPNDRYNLRLTRGEIKLAARVRAV